MNLLVFLGLIAPWESSSAQTKTYDFGNSSNQPKNYPTDTTGLMALLDSSEVLYWKGDYASSAKLSQIAHTKLSINPAQSGQ